MIHRAILGSVERFMAVMIEHYAGAFPFWLAPEQIRLVPVSDDFIDYCKEVKEKLELVQVRVEMDASKEGVGKKIRNAAMKKIPWTIVIGEKEAGGEDFIINVFGEDENLSVSQVQLPEKAKEAAKLPL